MASSEHGSDSSDQTSKLQIESSTSQTGLVKMERQKTDGGDTRKFIPAADGRKRSLCVESHLPVKVLKKDGDKEVHAQGLSQDIKPKISQDPKSDSSHSLSSQSLPVREMRKGKKRVVERSSDFHTDSPPKKTKTEGEQTKLETGEDGQKKHFKRRMKHLLQAVQDQMEFYFGDSNLSKDRYLKELIDTNPDGYVDLSVFGNFNKLQSLHKDGVSSKVIVNAVKRSKMLQVNDNQSKICRITAFNKISQEETDSRTIYVEHLPSHATQDWIRTVFSQCGKVVYISLPTYKFNKTIKGFAFVEFDCADEAAKACSMLNNPAPAKSEEKPGKFPRGNKTLNRLQRLVPARMDVVEQESHEENVSDEHQVETSKDTSFSAGGAANKKKKKKKSKRKKSQDGVTDENVVTVSDDGNVTLTEQMERKKKKKKKKRKQNVSLDKTSKNEMEEDASLETSIPLITAELSREEQDISHPNTEMEADKWMKSAEIDIQESPVGIDTQTNPTEMDIQMKSVGTNIDKEMEGSDTKKISVNFDTDRNVGEEGMSERMRGEEDDKDKIERGNVKVESGHMEDKNVKSGQAGQKIEERKVKSGQAGQKIEERKVKSGQAGQKIEERKVKSGQAGQKIEERKVKSGQAGQKIEEMKVKSGQAGQKIEEMKVKSGQAGQKIEERKVKSGQAGQKIEEMKVKSGQAGQKIEEMKVKKKRKKHKKKRGEKSQGEVRSMTGHGHDKNSGSLKIVKSGTVVEGVHISGRRERKLARQQDIRQKKLARERLAAGLVSEGEAQETCGTKVENMEEGGREMSVSKRRDGLGSDSMYSSEVTDSETEDAYRERRKTDGSELTSILKSGKGQERKKVEFDPIPVTTEFIKGREIRKRKKPKREKLHLRVIAKKEWLSLKAEYIAQQKSHMAALKESLRELRQQENQGKEDKLHHGSRHMDLEDVFGTKRLKPSQDVKMAHVEALKFTPNVIVQWKCSHEMHRDKIRNLFKEMAGDSIAYIDAKEEAKSGYIRFKDEASAEEFTRLSRQSTSFMTRILPADQQQAYWDKANEDRMKKLGRKTQEKGSERIARKVFERNKATFHQKSQRIVFNDDDSDENVETRHETEQTTEKVDDSVSG